MRICFPFIAQIHQVYHSLPIALEIARRYPEVEVHLAFGTNADMATARELAAVYDPQSSVRFHQFTVPALLQRLFTARGKTPKRLTLLCNLAYLQRFDALVMPERTTLRIRPLLPRAKFIWTRHGAGDRASGFERDIARFDFVLMAGTKIEQRLLAEGLIRAGRYASGVYAKFDLVRRIPQPPLFDNGRQTVLYNPHFWNDLSSWPLVGREVLQHFAGSDRFNLIFAPHIRLFYPPTPQRYAEFSAHAGQPHMRIDLGSPAVADMTYTRGADIYLGDVSSQVAEFLAVAPRPCIFLNPRRVSWRGDADYRFWELGQVIEDIGELPEALSAAQRLQPQYAELQRQYVTETFGDPARPSAPIGADAIVDFVARSLREAGVAEPLPEVLQA